jgi:hypothetical protein
MPKIWRSSGLNLVAFDDDLGATPTRPSPFSPDAVEKREGKHEPRVRTKILKSHLDTDVVCRGPDSHSGQPQPFALRWFEARDFGPTPFAGWDE